MSRIKHPVRAIREPFGTAGLIVAIIALILALTGAAFAAVGLNGKQKKEVTTIAKKFAGKPGAPGPAGAPGANGKDGAPGLNGKEGPEGPTGPEGPEGPAGSEGPEGPEGSPWTAGGTLPSEKTETGTWSYRNTEGKNSPFVPISFTIPLAAELEEGKVHFVTKAQATAHSVLACPGEVTAPKAEPGNLCVYEGLLLNGEFAALDNPTAFPPAAGASTAGSVLALNATGNPSFNYGTWAVTAP